jgi:hypothetical protein
VLLLSILIVVINIFSTLIVAVLTNYIKSRLVVSIELNGHKILTLIANLGK